MFSPYRLKTQMHKENVQLLQNKRKQHIQERDKVKEEVCSVELFNVEQSR